MSGTRRLQKEFKDLQSSGIIETESVKNLEIDSQSILQWSGNLNPTKVTVDLRFFFVKWGISLCHIPHGVALRPSGRRIPLYKNLSKK